MSVYFVRRQDGRIKIGYSDAVRKRMYEIRVLHGPLELLAVREGGYEEEHRIHAELAAHRLGKTEWFETSEEVLQAVVDARATGHVHKSRMVVVRLHGEDLRALAHVRAALQAESVRAVKDAEVLRYCLRECAKSRRSE